jgi:MFS transporter, ACS family, tartrate transporter
VIAPLSPARVANTRQHVALRLLPFLFVLYITNFLDRTSVAYAAIGMARDLGFNDRVFGMGIGVFFVSYLALQIPGALLVERWSARGMISATMITWGSLTALTALVHTPTQLYLARFVLGGAEAGFFPGVIVYLSHWFVHEDRAKATSSFMAAAPLSLIIGSPIAGWILGHSWLAIEGWRWLFLLEGLPAVVLGIVAFFFLTDWPREATWLAAEQQQWLQQKLDAERLPIRQSVTLGQALRSRTVCLLTAAAFLEYFVGYAVVFWLPTVLKRLSGFSDLQVGLLGSVPYIVALAAMLINGWHSDKTRERRWHAAVPLFISAVGLLCLIALSGPKLMIVFWFCLTSVCMAFLPAFWAIPTELLSASTAAATVGMINAVASIAGFAGPYAFGYLNSRTGSPSAGFAVLVCSALAAAILMLLTPTGKAHTALD